MSEPAQLKKPKRDVNGILLLDKPSGLSSNAALQRVKYAYGARKAGHTGSLDNLATGLLPICFGEATKVSAYLLEANKRYISDVQLGVVTKTADSEGEVIRRADEVNVSRSDVETAMQGFRGPISQVPPMHSAVKLNGKRLYKLAHKGIEIPREPRTVTIHELDLLSLDGDRMRIGVACSKGTYIRTLAEDIGEALGCGAHVATLRRTHSGPFALTAAYTLDEILEIADQSQPYLKLDEYLLPVDTALKDMPDLHLSEESAFSVCRGQAVEVAHAPNGGLVRLYNPARDFLGVGRVLDDGRIAPRRLMR